MDGAPDGLLFEAEIMTAAEEAAFLNLIGEMSFGPFRMHGVDAKRHVVRFWRSLSFWFGGNEADIRVSALSGAASRAGSGGCRCAHARPL
jgi:hypothetical protein